MLAEALDFRCQLCSQLIPPAQYLCAPCQDGMAELPEELARPPHEPYLRALYSYDGNLAGLLWRLKYRGEPSCAALLGSYLWKARHGASSLCDAVDAIVPVPLHPWREWSRGFNQCEEILRWAQHEAQGQRPESRRSAPGMAPILSGLLYRRRVTRPQRGQSAPTRRQISAQSFAVRRGWQKQLPPDPRILLFDDVLTTGSTLRACRQALAQAGIAKCSGLALLRRL